MTTKHTQAPWIANSWFVDSINGRGIVTGVDCPDNDKENIANALLIAAAPELLEALEEAVLSHITIKTSHYMAKAVLNGVPLPSNVDFPNWVIGGALAIKKARN